MLETGRRTAISTSELGLYSDRADRRYARTRYGSVLKKFAVGAMVVLTVLLVAIFFYDFTSATAGSGKVSQETKHIYILQNALKKSSGLSRRPADSPTRRPEFTVNRTESIPMQDRSDSEHYEDSLPQQEDATDRIAEPEPEPEPEYRAQNLHNFKLRKRVLKSVEDGMDVQPAESKQMFDNHAIVYRLRQRYNKQATVSEEEADSEEESRPLPFHWEYKTAHPSSFKRTKYPQLSQYRYPQSSRNIQDIIKYLTNDGETANRGIKFSGVYVNPKKYDLISGFGEAISGSDRSEEEDRHRYSFNDDDPFYQYKPKHPADVNLLATSNVRFSPTGPSRYYPYRDPFHGRPVPLLEQYGKPGSLEAYDGSAAYLPSSAVNKRKPKPFSVMLDIYPITDLTDQTRKTSTRPRAQPIADYDSRRLPTQLNRGKFYGSAPHHHPGQQVLSEEEEKRQQMIFHLNLYPRRKSKLTRHDIIQRSETMEPEERRRFVHKIMSPLESIAKHLTDQTAIEESNFFSEKGRPEGPVEGAEEGALPATRYQEIVLDPITEPSPGSEEGLPRVPSNHKSETEEDYASSTGTECPDCGTSIKPDAADTTVRLPKDLDTLEGFQRFSDAASSGD